MEAPKFITIETADGEGVTYSCGCAGKPTARPAADGSAGHEHCCCGKVHFVGAGAPAALAVYLELRKAQRNKEPDYEVGQTDVMLAGAAVPVAWAFPVAG